MAFQKDTGYISVDSQILWYPAVYSWGIYILILRYIKLALFTLDSTNEKVNFLLFSRQFVPNSLQSYRLQHTRLLCPPLSSRVCSNSWSLSQWCYVTVSSSAARFSFCLQSFPVSESFPMSWLFTSDGQSIGASTSTSVLPMNIQGLFPLGLTGLILLSKGLSRVFSSTTVWKHQFIGTQGWEL